ncbi:MAG: beta-lactamase family protein, partial [Thermoanaerobaculia bacterium]|nr:beta-lactamase family protein [Thermoanaerobaculia bacterium]
MSLHALRRLSAVLFVAATAAAAVAAQAPPALADAELTARLERYLDAAAREGFTGAVLVARGSRVLVERGYGIADPGRNLPVSATTVFTTGSITKQFTAAAVLKLEEQGRLAVGDPISKYLGEVPPDKTAITIHHLLSHQAGFPGALGDDRERIGRDDYVRQALAAPLLFAPGGGYEYSNVGFSLAAAIVERVAGAGYETFLRDTLWLPAGMRDTGYHLPAWTPERHAHGVRQDGGDWGTEPGNFFTDGGPGWHLLGNGGVLSTTGDMLRWHRALQGESILSASSKAKLFAKHVDEGGGTWYGYGWSIEPTPWGEMVTHNGGNPFFFADYLRFPEADVVVYFTTSSRDRRMRRLGRPLARIVFTGEAPPFEPPPAPLQAPGSAAAPAGSAAARWGLPGTPAGERAGALLDALAAASGAERERFAGEGFAPAVVARRGAQGLVELLERMRGDLGEDFRLRGFRPGQNDGLVVVLAANAGPGPMQITLDVEPGAPHRIAGIG